jgi:hypothetical protein
MEKALRRFTLTEVTVAYTAFGLSVVAALLGAEVAPSLMRYRALYTLWAAAALSIPALCCYILEYGIRKRRSYWLLFWTFSFLAFLIHLAYAAASRSRFSWIEVLLAAAWAVDLVFAWSATSRPGWERTGRVAVLVAVIAWLTWSTLGYREDGPMALRLGIALPAAAIICLWRRWRRSHPDPEALPA